MKIAIFHNYMDNIGGAEIVALTFARELDADIYTTLVDKEHIATVGFADVLPRIHSIGKIPKQAPFKQQIAFWKFRRLNLPKKFPGKYDFYVIAGDWAMSAAVNNKPNLWYAHAPLNEIWQFHDMVRKEMVQEWKHPVFEAWVRFNRKLTLSYARHVERWVSNSENTRGRIRKFYGMEAAVIHPPVDVKKYAEAAGRFSEAGINSTDTEARGAYWLSVNRLVNHKRIGMQFGAFRLLPDEKLVVVGSYEKDVTHFERHRAELEREKPSNVELLHWVDDGRLAELYAGCKGFITTSRDEDFGMTAVEAMAAGKPVIAPDEGGYRESVVNEKTGLLVGDITPEKLAAAVRKIDAGLAKDPSRYAEACMRRAAGFDVKKSIAEIRKQIGKNTRRRSSSASRPS